MVWDQKWTHIRQVFCWLETSHMQSNLSQLEWMLLGCDQYPVIGKSGREYHFNARAYPFDAPHDPAIFYLVRLTEQTNGKWDCVVLYRGLVSDLQQELSRHKMRLFDNNQSPNAILWLHVVNAMERLAIWYDLAGLVIGIDLDWCAVEQKTHTDESFRHAVF